MLPKANKSPCKSFFILKFFFPCLNKKQPLMCILTNLFGPASARSNEIGVAGNNWLVGWLVGWLVDWLVGWFVTQYEKVSKLAQNQTLIFSSKMAVTTFLDFGLKLVLNMNFNLNETYFSEKIAISRYLASKSSKNCPNWGFSPFSRLCIISFPWFCT